MLGQSVLVSWPPCLVFIDDEMPIYLTEQFLDTWIVLDVNLRCSFWKEIRK